MFFLVVSFCCENAVWRMPIWLVTNATKWQSYQDDCSGTGSLLKSGEGGKVCRFPTDADLFDPFYTGNFFYHEVLPVPARRHPVNPNYVNNNSHSNLGFLKPV